MERNSKLAEQLCSAIKELAANEDLLTNFGGYLSRHFDAWVSNYADTPAKITEEFCAFAKINFDDSLREEEKKIEPFYDVRIREIGNPENDDFWGRFEEEEDAKKECEMYDYRYLEDCVLYEMYYEESY